jgi:phosphonate transport system substrate-binding protein
MTIRFLKRVLGWLLFVGLAFLAGCERAPEQGYQPQFAAAGKEQKPVYVFAVHPLHNPTRLFEMYQPILDWINARLPEAKLQLEASRNYDEFDKKLYAGKFQFALPNPYQTVNSLDEGYHVIAKMGDDQLFTGVILVRRDSSIRVPADLKGKKISYPAKTALAATMMPQYYLLTHGLDVRRDVENLYVGSQESSIMNVYLGNVAAGATWPLPWLQFQREQPAKAAELMVKWETEPLVNNGVVARDDVPPALAEKVAGLLASLHESPEGRSMLAKISLSRFELATNKDYDKVNVFVAKYRRAMGIRGK